jgi:hypothetical protein
MGSAGMSHFTESIVEEAALACNTPDSKEEAPV